jgi:hypothetical protein
MSRGRTDVVRAHSNPRLLHFAKTDRCQSQGFPWNFLTVTDFVGVDIGIHQGTRRLTGWLFPDSGELRDQEPDQRFQQRLTSSSDVVNELKEAQVER